MSYPRAHTRLSRAPMRGAASRRATLLQAAATVLLSGAALLVAHASPARVGNDSKQDTAPTLGTAPTHGAAATGADGRALYLAHCGICHLEGGTGTFMLGRRLGKQRALLADRADLTAAYVEAVVRNGLNAMPAFTRVEITDRELDAVAQYLAHSHESIEAQRRP